MVQQTLTSGPGGGSEVGEEEEEEEVDTWETPTISTQGARGNMIDTMERMPFIHFCSPVQKILMGIFVIMLLTTFSNTYSRGISPDEKRGGRGPWNWGCVEEAAR